MWGRVKIMFIPKAVYYEAAILNYPLGQELYERYKKMGVPFNLIENHNSIKEMQEKSNREFPQMKQNLIIGVRKTHKYVPNCKISDFLVPYTSSGCSAMCLYCYLVCNYNKCSYMRLFVNREHMMQKLVRTANASEKELTFEIGSNSDLVLENEITGNLEWTITQFARVKKGFITFPTKFNMIDPLLELNHGGRTIVRMSVNPEEIIKKSEFGTSALNDRIEAINRLKSAGYKTGILIAPVVMVENWKEKYTELIKLLKVSLSEKVKNDVFFEIIFMTYSYVHRMINKEAFPNAVELFDPELMTGRGRGKYAYKPKQKQEGEAFFREVMHEHFPENRIFYIV